MYAVVGTLAAVETAVRVLFCAVESWYHARGRACGWINAKQELRVVRTCEALHSRRCSKNISFDLRSALALGGGMRTLGAGSNPYACRVCKGGNASPYGLALPPFIFQAARSRQ